MFNVKGNAGGSACISELHAGCPYQLQLLRLKTDLIQQANLQLKSLIIVIPKLT
jgi:hypothetical protein